MIDPRTEDEPGRPAEARPFSARHRLPGLICHANSKKIGQVRLSTPVTLAPMEEHTNLPFRLLMKRFGAGLVCTERIDANDVARRDRRALRMLRTSSEERPRAAQISGAQATVMAEAARVVEEQGFEMVDLNFECPVRRLVARGEGGALMANPDAIGRIVAAVSRAVSIPVTVKLRTGPDGEHETAAEVARQVEQAGGGAVCLHARSVAQAYAGGADWNVVARVKQAVRLPVIGSGGIADAADGVRRLRESGADGIAIGRGCLGNPWIFRQCQALLAGNPAGRPPARSERGRAMLQLVEGEFRYYGPGVAIRRLSRTSCYFAKSLPDFAEFRSAVHRVRDLAGFRRLAAEYFR
ncbi:MAG: tRNA dihydrouridine synthase DusB [Thermoguttaceae bacterium]